MICMYIVIRKCLDNGLNCNVLRIKIRIRKNKIGEKLSANSLNYIKNI